MGTTQCNKVHQGWIRTHGWLQAYALTMGTRIVASKYGEPKIFAVGGLRRQPLGIVADTLVQHKASSLLRIKSVRSRRKDRGDNRHKY